MMKVVVVVALVGSTTIAVASAGGLRGQPEMRAPLQLKFPVQGLDMFKYLQVAQVGYDYTRFSPDDSADAQMEYIFDFSEDFNAKNALNPFETVQIIDNLKCNTQTVNTTVSSEKSLVDSLEKGISFDVAVPIPLEAARRRRLQASDSGKDGKGGDDNSNTTKPLPAPVLKGKFSMSNTYKQVSSQSTGDFYISYMAQFICQVKTVSIEKDNLPSLHQTFVQRISDMYERAHLGQDILKPMAEELIANYGTHYIAKAAIGASYTRSFKLEGRSTEAAYMTESDKKKAASLSLDESASIGVSKEDKTSTSSFSKFQKSTTVDIESSVGLAPKGDGSSSRSTILSDWETNLIAATEKGESSKLGLIVIPTEHSLNLVPLCDLLVWGPYIEKEFKRLDHFTSDQKIDTSLLVEVREELYRAIYSKCADCADPKGGADLFKDQTIKIDETQKWTSIKFNNPYNGHPSKHAPTLDISTKDLFGDIAESSSRDKVNQAVYIDSITLAKGNFANYAQSTVMGLRFNYKNVEKNDAAHFYDYGSWIHATANDVANTAYIGGRDIVEVQLFAGDLLEGMLFTLKEATGTSTTECIGNCGFSHPTSFRAPSGGRLIGIQFQCMDGGADPQNRDCTLGVVNPVWAQ